MEPAAVLDGSQESFVIQRDVAAGPRSGNRAPPSLELLWVQKPTLQSDQRMSASLIGRRGQALSDYPPLQCRCRSQARASLRNRHRALPSWDSRTTATASL